jgi:hypothetical protein
MACATVSKSRHQVCTKPSPKASQRSKGTNGCPASLTGTNIVKISVENVRIEHEVRLADFTKWLDKTGGSPREVSERQRIRAILGLGVTRPN